MDDRLFFPLLALVVLAMVALAAVWPQGLGLRSPPPFGHAPAAASKPSPVGPTSTKAPGPARALEPG
jgi:hypothetical protein